MRLTIHAVGRMKSGPERDLAARYHDRLTKLAPSLGLSAGDVIEITESRQRSSDDRKAEEARQLHERFSTPRHLVLLDERGKTLSSPDLAQMIGDIRDQGCRDMVFAIGGPDGHDKALRTSADLVLGFGTMTWPHQLVRIMLAEQLYRSATILAGHPYHRS
jgi:23S rRNA (pseudouridine1915-N3)-methyltransferase